VSLVIHPKEVVTKSSSGLEAPPTKNYELFMVFRVSQRDVRSCVEKFVGAGSPSYKKLLTFHGFQGVPIGT
jgi:hypothetical protein